MFELHREIALEYDRNLEPINPLAFKPGALQRLKAEQVQRTLDVIVNVVLILVCLSVIAAVGYLTQRFPSLPLMGRLILTGFALVGVVGMTHSLVALVSSLNR